jgi:branched-subunit amino acid transport protein
MMWAAVLGMGAGCYLLKLAGLSVPEAVLDHPTVRRVADLLPVVLLAALVVVQVLSEGPRLLLDARVPALVVALVALLLRASFLVVVALAAVTAAAIRLL